METPKTSEEDILNALIDFKCKEALTVLKLIKRHVNQEKERLNSQVGHWKVKFANLERLYNTVLEVRRENGRKH